MELETETDFLSNLYLLIGLPDAAPDKILLAIFIIESTRLATKILLTQPLTGL